MVSRTKVDKRIKRKTNPELSEAIYLAKKNKSWFRIAEILSGPTKKQVSLNLEQIDLKSKAGDVIIIPGRVLGIGSLSKKIKICSLGASDSAKLKIKDSKSELSSILSEIKNNPKAQGVKILQ